MQNVKIGAHVSIAGGYIQSLERIVGMGGNCMQIFSSSPRSWIIPSISKETIQEFINKKNELVIGSIYFHATYLVNLADNDIIGERSKKALVTDLKLADSLGMQGVVVHLGSFKNGTKENPYKHTTIDPLEYEILLRNIRDVLELSEVQTPLLIENAGTRKIGWNIDEIAFIIKSIGSNRLKVCLDTCHLHAAGYDLSTEEKYKAFFDHFDKEIGLKKLELIHFNDSKDPFESFRDRHENIGEGEISETVFYNLTQEEQTKNLPFILEVPGFDKKGPDEKNIMIVKEIASRNDR